MDSLRSGPNKHSKSILHNNSLLAAGGCRQYRENKKGVNKNHGGDKQKETKNETRQVFPSLVYTHSLL